MIQQVRLRRWSWSSRKETKKRSIGYPCPVHPHSSQLVSFCSLVGILTVWINQTPRAPPPKKKERKGCWRMKWPLFRYKERLNDVSMKKQLSDLAIWFPESAFNEHLICARHGCWGGGEEGRRYGTSQTLVCISVTWGSLYKVQSASVAWGRTRGPAFLRSPRWWDDVYLKVSLWALRV